jgi:hypothetical protein
MIEEAEEKLSLTGNSTSFSYDYRNFSFENSLQSDWCFPVSSNQQKSGMWEYTYSSAVNIVKVLCLAIKVRVVGNGLTGRFVPPSITRRLTGNNTISAVLKPISPFAPSMLTGLSEPIKLPLLLTAAVQ